MYNLCTLLVDLHIQNNKLKTEVMIAVKIETSRTGYTVSQVANKTLTVGELIELLQDYDEDAPIVFSNDNGYTYGELTARCLSEEETEEEI